MTEVYLVVVASSCPGDGWIEPYTTKEEAIKHFERLLKYDSEEVLQSLDDQMLDDLLNNSASNTIEEWKENARKDLKFYLDDGQHIWLTEVQTKTVKAKFEAKKK